MQRMSMVLESVDRSRRFPLDRESVFIGSSEWKADICLAEPDVADVHCELTRQATGVRVVALSDGGVTVNGTVVREGTLTSGDELGIASLRFRLAVDLPEDERAPLDLKDLSEAGSDDSDVSAERIQWIVRVSGMRLGPLSWSEMQTMIARGELRLDDEAQPLNESAWLRVRDVIPRSGGEGILCDDTSTEESQSERQLPTSRRICSGDDDVRLEDSIAASTDSERTRETPVDSASDDVPLAPQFFIMRRDEETGPLPRLAIQELADEGVVLADTPVRLEESTEWTTAKAVGIHCRADSRRETVSQPAEDSQLTTGWDPGWLIFAPYYFVTGLLRSTTGLSRKQAGYCVAVALIVGTIAFGWIRSWSQTALRGTVTLDGQPVPEVLIELTGVRTGDSAMGTTDGTGRFRMVTLDGELTPGRYLVTVRPLSEFADGHLITTVPSVAPAAEGSLPARYRHLNTTDVAIEITSDARECVIALTNEPLAAGSQLRAGPDLIEPEAD